MNAENIGAQTPSIALNKNAMSTNSITSAVMEAIHLRKYFPLRQFKLFGKHDMVHAVEDTSLSLYPGRALALVGESGSGKTTMARMLARLYEPTSGTILFRGKPVKVDRGTSLRSYRHHVQLVFQDPFSSLNPVHDVRYQLSRPLRLHGYAHSAREEG